MIKNISLPNSQQLSFQKRQSIQNNSSDIVIKSATDNFKRSESQQVSFNGLLLNQSNEVQSKLKVYLKEPNETNLKTLIDPDTVRYVADKYLYSKIDYENSNFLLKPLKKRTFEKFEKIFNAMTQTKDAKDHAIVKNGIKEAGYSTLDSYLLEFKNQKDVLYSEALKLCLQNSENDLDKLEAVIKASGTSGVQSRSEALNQLMPTIELFFNTYNPSKSEKREVINLFLKAMINIEKACDCKYKGTVSEDALKVKTEFKNMLENNPKMPEDLKVEIVKIIKDAKKVFSKDLWYISLNGKAPDKPRNAILDETFRKENIQDSKNKIAGFDKDPDVKEPDDNPSREQGFTDKDYADYVLQTDIGEQLQKNEYNEAKLEEFFNNNPNPTFNDDDNVVSDGICHPRDLQVAGLAIQLLEELAKSTSNTKLGELAKKISRVRCPEGYENDPNNFFIVNWGKTPPANSKNYVLTNDDINWLNKQTPSNKEKVKGLRQKEVQNIRTWELKHKKSYFKESNEEQKRIQKLGILL